MKTSYEWKSDIADMIKLYLQEKRQMGYKFENQEAHLRHFDSYYFYNGYDGVNLTKQMLNDFIYNKYERPSTHYNKERVMNSFSNFLNDYGSNVYVPTIKTILPRNNFKPHIYTKEELKRFFAAVDNFPQTANSNRNVLDPILFRFLYATGARISEALNLTVADINLDESIVTIRHAKNNKDRLLPIAKSLNERLCKYIHDFHRFSNNESILFPGLEMKCMNKSTAYNHFRDYLLMADIPHTAKGPRIHDFRHGFAVACLKKWAILGNDITNMLPYLAAYMGHSDYRATQYYLRLTADLYPHILSKTEAQFGYVIPEGGFYYEES